MRSIEVDDDISLRVPAKADAPVYYLLIDQNRDYIGRWDVSVTRTRGVEMTERVIDAWQRQADEGSAFHYLVEYRGVVVGKLGVMHLDEPENYAELGYWLSEDMQGHGIITRSCKAVLRWLFEEHGTNRVAITAAAPNTKSRAVAERLGFKLDGLLRELMLVDGNYCDGAVYSMLAREWKSS